VKGVATAGQSWKERPCERRDLVMGVV